MDTTTTPHSKFSCSKRFYLPCSFKRSCCFFLTFVLLIVVVLGLTALIIFVVLKPQKPLFSIQTAKIESYKLDMEHKKDLFVSSVLSLTLNASNPNRVGISYGTSRLHVLENGIVIGMIRISRFHQPPQSKNLSVQAQVIFECVNVSEITSGNLMRENSRNGLFQIRVLGDIRAQVRILRVTLPKLQIALDCDITIDHKYLTFNYDMNSMKAVKNNMISLPMVSQLFSNKCSVAIYV